LDLHVGHMLCSDPFSAAVVLCGCGILQERARKWEKELEAATKEKEGEVLRPIDPTTAASNH
jgi:hypothetical protein